jgi:hypothetical protein
VQGLQHHREYAMTLQARNENHIGLDRTARRTAVHDPLVSVGSVRNAKSRMDLRTMYPTDREYQQTT